MSSRILELFTISTHHQDINWDEVARAQPCSYLERKCVKIRKSQPDISIGTCSVAFGISEDKTAIICPHRFLERKQIFIDCIHLLTLHEPGNELHKVPEVSVPGGSVDYVLASVRNGRVVDFVGIELQAIDTTGTTWTARQRFLKSVGVNVEVPAGSERAYGMNWKMTAKTILVQLHHKAETFEAVNKHMVLVLQDCLFDYMQSAFRFSHVENAKLGDSMQFHIYSLLGEKVAPRLKLSGRKSTDAKGVATSLGLQANPNVELEVIIAALQEKISERTLLTI